MEAPHFVRSEKGYIFLNRTYPANKDEEGAHDQALE